MPKLSTVVDHFTDSVMAVGYKAADSLMEIVGRITRALWTHRDKLEAVKAQRAENKLKLNSKTRIQLDWPWIAEWAYAGIFAVAIWFHHQDQF